jgi:hypothetical protein
VREDRGYGGEGCRPPAQAVHGPHSPDRGARTAAHGAACVRAVRVGPRCPPVGGRSREAVELGPSTGGQGATSDGDVRRRRAQTSRTRRRAPLRVRPVLL